MKKIKCGCGQEIKEMGRRVECLGQLMYQIECEACKSTHYRTLDDVLDWDKIRLATLYRAASAEALSESLRKVGA